jgi:hypothetical protein
MPLTHRPFSRSTWYLLAVIVVAQFAMISGSILYTNYMIQKFCELIVISDEAYKQPLPPGIPVTQTRRDLAAAMHKLREDLRCDKKKAQ